MPENYPFYYLSWVLTTFFSVFDQPCLACACYIFVGCLQEVPRGDILSSDPYLMAYLGNPEDPHTLSYM